MVKIVAVQFRDKKDPDKFAGREYLYFDQVGLSEGDVTLAPAGVGMHAVRVSRANVSSTEARLAVKGELKTIRKRVPPLERPNWCCTTPGRGCAICAEPLAEMSD